MTNATVEETVSAPPGLSAIQTINAHVGMGILVQLYVITKDRLQQL